MVILLSILIILLDQYTKRLAVVRLKESESIIVIENFFRLTYVENSGAAFGILQDKKIIFFIITIIALFILFSLLYKYYYDMNLTMKLSMTLLIGGTIGNFIDRIKYGYVVDFLSFQIFGYNFPVFNIADMSIVIGTGILILLILKEDFS